MDQMSDSLLSSLACAQQCTAQSYISCCACFDYYRQGTFSCLRQEMTYVKQLEDYEEAVMKKRLEEMPETERERLLEEIEQEKEQKAK